MERPRVLIVEDDETLSQFFSMVLEMLPVRGQMCSSAEEALERLAHDPAALIVTDLMLPGMGGRSLLSELQSNPVLRAQAVLVVMSGSMDEAVRHEAHQLGAWRVLVKPVSIDAFKTCVMDALTVWKAASRDAKGWLAHEQEAIQEHFAGDVALFKAYRLACLKQFPHDVQAGQDALDQGEREAFKRVAHNLKSVLKTLGLHRASELARALEHLCSQGHPAEMLTPHWNELRECLMQSSSA